ncbi:hypothetical protein ABZ759_07915 [Streptomyces sp. NPDC047860]|uniref:hypothetical protein n=1 Tax=Streptomyces sp. NPDC047860 TaxID=3155743 RepID=UPI0033D9DD07
MANEQPLSGTDSVDSVDSPTGRPEDRLHEARRSLAGFAGTADEALRTRSSAVGPLLDGLTLLVQRLGTELTRVDDDAAPVLQSLLQDLDRAVRAGAATGTRGRTAPAPWAPSGIDDAPAAVRYAQEAAEAAQEAAHATARARLAADRAWEAKAAAVTASLTARQDADTAEEQARAAQELTRTAREDARAARENARQAREQAQAAEEETRIAQQEAQAAQEEAQAARERARTADEEARAAQKETRTAQEQARQADERAHAAQDEARQAQDEADTHRRDMVEAEARAEEARLKKAEAHGEAAEAVRAAKAAQAEADAAERAASEQRDVRAAAEERTRQARAEAERESRCREEAEAESVRAESARQEARRARFRAELRLSADLIWDRYRDPAFAFGTEEPPADTEAGALWSRVHVALLRLTEPDRLREASALAALARRCGLEPGGIAPGEPPGPGRTVVAVPALPEYGVGELRLRTDVPRWADLTVDERAEVTALLASARAEAEGGSPDRLAALLSSPQDDDLLLTALLRIWQADGLLALDTGLGRWPDARKRRWVAWTREDFRKQAVHQLALLAGVYPEPVTGWAWARPGDAETAVVWLHSLDAVLGFHHRAPALRGSWWWSWRLALAAELVHPAGWAGRRAVVDPDELTRLFTGPRSKDYFEQPDVCDRVDPPIQWLASPPLVAADEEANPRCLRKGRIVRGVGRG